MPALRDLFRLPRRAPRTIRIAPDLSAIAPELARIAAAIERQADQSAALLAAVETYLDLAHGIVMHPTDEQLATMQAEQARAAIPEEVLAVIERAEAAGRPIPVDIYRQLGLDPPGSRRNERMPEFDEGEPADDEGGGPTDFSLSEPIEPPEPADPFEPDAEPPASTRKEIP